MGFEYELYEAPDKKFGSMSEVPILIRILLILDKNAAYLGLECCLH